MGRMSNDLAWRLTHSVTHTHTSYTYTNTLHAHPHTNIDMHTHTSTHTQIFTCAHTCNFSLSEIYTHLHTHTCILTSIHSARDVVVFIIINSSFIALVLLYVLTCFVSLRCVCLRSCTAQLVRPSGVILYWEGPLFWGPLPLYTCWFLQA